jgi:hypothetical protein
LTAEPLQLGYKGKEENGKRKGERGKVKVNMGTGEMGDNM